MKTAITCGCVLLMCGCLVSCGRQPEPNHPDAVMRIVLGTGGGSATPLYNPDRQTPTFIYSHYRENKKVVEVEWGYVGTTELGDVYTVVLTVPDGRPPPKSPQAIIFTGQKLVLYEGTTCQVLIEPENPFDPT